MIKSLKNITVLGAGKSGIGAAVLAKKNIEVVLFNDEPINSSTKEFLNTLKINGLKNIIKSI